jgi:hypothetical protein
MIEIDVVKKSITKLKRIREMEDILEDIGKSTFAKCKRFNLY